MTFIDDYQTYLFALPVKIYEEKNDDSSGAKSEENDRDEDNDEIDDEEDEENDEVLLIQRKYSKIHK